MNKQAIQLENTVLDFSALVSSLPIETYFVKGKPTGMVDFGTLVIHEDESLSEENWNFINEVHSIDEHMSPVFLAPWSWRMPHVVKALGAFSSTSAAMKNGWNLDVPMGISEHPVRINKIRGVITIHKVPAGGIPLCDDDD